MQAKTESQAREKTALDTNLRGVFKNMNNDNKLQHK